jgi:hypothetical protein
MPEISTSIVYENEIVKSTDFEHGFGSLIKNLVLMDKMLVSSTADYLIGGKVKADPNNSMNVYIEPLFSNGRQSNLFSYLDHNSDLVPINPAGINDRIDVVQIRGETEEYDQQQRAFYDTESGGEIYLDMKTKIRLIVNITVKQGVEGIGSAPVVDSGWIKLAEILVPANSLAITNDNIRNVTAITQGNENTEWTNERGRTFYLGSWNELKTMIGKEHNTNGTHKEKVIKAGNIDFGVGANKVNGLEIPLGEGYIIGNDGPNQETFTAETSLRDTIRQESITRKNQIDAIYLDYDIIYETMASLLAYREFTHNVIIDAPGVKVIPFSDLNLNNGESYVFKAQLSGCVPSVRNIGVEVNQEKTEVRIYLHYDNYPYKTPFLGAPVVKAGARKVGEFLVGESDPIKIYLFVRKEVF